MKVVIVEDEFAASDNLTYLLKQIEPDIEVLDVLDSVKSAISYFSKPHKAELVFMDIHLADGRSFEIFERVTITSPVIFTTAYDQYALQAFKVHSIDYLLKPIDQQELEAALVQFKTQLHGNIGLNEQMERLLSLIKTRKRTYKSSYLVSQKDQMVPLKTSSIAYIYIDASLVKAVTLDKQTYLLDKKLEDMEFELDPEFFYRINRQFIVNREAIQNIQNYFNNKLLVNLSPPSRERAVVSKAKAAEFKQWLNT